VDNNYLHAEVLYLEKDLRVLSTVYPMQPEKTTMEKHPHLVYFVPFVFTALSYVVFSWCNLFHTDTNSARYMLSALVQSEAAIIAIVFTLSLVAIQLTASSYSPTIIEIFRKTPDLWLLMGLYIFSIAYGLAILKIISWAMEPLLETYIVFSYFLGIFCFTTLIPYTYVMFIMLKPSTFIEKLSQKINKEELLHTEPIQPIIDIVRRSMMEYDHETAREGLDAIGEKASSIFRRERFIGDEETNISEKVYRHFFEIGKLALNKGDEGPVMVVIENIRKTGTTAVEKNLGIAAMKSVAFLSAIGIAAVNKNFEDISSQAIQSLTGIGIAAVKRERRTAEKVRMAEKVAASLSKISIAALRQKLEITAKVALQGLHTVGIAAHDRGNKRTLKIVAGYLEEFEGIAFEGGTERLKMFAHELATEIREKMDNFRPHQ